MCYQILVSQSSMAVTYSELGEEARCVERLQHLCQTAEPVHRRFPPPTVLMNHSLRVEFGPLRFTCFPSSLPNENYFFLFPFHLAKPG